MPDLKIDRQRRAARRRAHYSSVLSGTALLLGPLAGTTAVWADDPIMPYIPPNPNNDPDYYNITNPQYGGGTSASAATNAAAISAAMNACSNGGGGTVVIPAGTFQCDPMNLSNLSNVNLQVDGTLQAEDMADFNSGPNGYSYYIYWKNAHSDMLSGTGTIDGNGASWWASTGTRPKFLNFSNGQVVAVENVTLQNTPKEGITFSGTKTTDITINGVTITSPSNSPNTDGIDPNGKNFLIENCDISTGDDNIAIKSGSTGGNPPNNVIIRDDVFGYGHGLSIGGQTNYGVNGVTVTNCTFINTQNGIRLKAGRGNGGVVQNLSFSNITMTNVANAIYITSWYGSGSDVPPWPPSSAVNKGYNPTGTPLWRNISISNLTDTDAEYAVWIYGLPEEPVQDVTLNNVDISGLYGCLLNYAGYNGAYDPNAPPDPNYQLLLQNCNIQSVYDQFIPPPKGMYDVVMVVPEPATASMALLGSSVLLLRRRRSNAA